VPGSAPVTGDDPSDYAAAEARSAFNQGLAALRPWNQSLAFRRVLVAALDLS
jgi:hypothetical protein